MDAARHPSDIATPPAAAGNGYRVRLGTFEGTLGELARALRSERLQPEAVDLLALVRDCLEYFEATAGSDLDLASEALPPLAQVIELKVRLLLPHPPRADEDDADSGRVEALEAVETLVRLEAAIAFLRARRERRRHLLPARGITPSFPRPARPLDLAVAHLAAVAARYRVTSYFEIARERLSVPEAMRRLLTRLRSLGRAGLRAVTAPGDWATRTVYFVGLLELIREGRVRAEQAAPYEEIELTLERENG
jgi:segregation and condensation protein A